MCKFLTIVCDGARQHIRSDRLSLYSQSVPATGVLYASLITCDGEPRMPCTAGMQIRTFIVSLGLCISALLQVGKWYLVSLVILCAVRVQPDFPYLQLLMSRCCQGAQGSFPCLRDSQRHPVSRYGRFQNDLCVQSRPLIILLAGAVSALLHELGYPCYLVSGKYFQDSTIDGKGSGIRSYIDFVIAIC